VNVNGVGQVTIYNIVIRFTRIAFSAAISSFLVFTSGIKDAGTFDVGMDLNAAVDKETYKTPYKFTGAIDSVTVELTSAKTTKK